MSPIKRKKTPEVQTLRSRFPFTQLLLPVGKTERVLWEIKKKKMLDAISVYKNEALIITIGTFYVNMHTNKQLPNYVYLYLK